MSSSVQVLAPNGRRQTVKCSANTTILQIIEEVCKKQGFKPEEYDIKHHNKVLDTTIAFRFSGLPNNAQLELATATKTRVDSEVTLAISLEDGNRVMGTFLPDENLLNVLKNLCPNEIKEDVVVVYMRNEIFGGNLQKTTLRSLGLVGGRAMLRIVHKAPDELKTQANVSSPLPAKTQEEKPFRRVLKPEEEGQKPVQKKPDVDLLKLAKDREKRKLATNKTPESPRSKPKIEQVEQMDVDVPQEREENFVFLGDRQAMLFSLESAKSLPAEDLPDDFFELTIDDAKKILHDIKRKRAEMENANLMTSAMRNLEDSKKQLRHLHKYKQSVIRIQFGDRTILQGSFKPIETIKDVKDFVRGYIQEANTDFYLYTTPPKSILSEQARLVEIGCVPGALLHIGTNAENTINLKTELKNKFTTNSLASLAASKMRKATTRPDSPQDLIEDSMESVPSTERPGPSTEPTSYERKIIKTTDKVPKWFKPAK